MSDNHCTSKKAYMMLKPYVKSGLTIYDPFYFDGSCKEYIMEVFESKNVVNEDLNAFDRTHPECDLIITNPPFSRKYDALEMLFNIDKPFIILLPLETMTTIKFRNVKGHQKLQLLIPRGRMKFEKEGQKNRRFNFDTAWYCYKMDLEKDIIFLR